MRFAHRKHPISILPHSVGTVVAIFIIIFSVPIHHRTRRSTVSQRQHRWHQGKINSCTLSAMNREILSLASPSYFPSDMPPDIIPPQGRYRYHNFSLNNQKISGFCLIVRSRSNLNKATPTSNKSREMDADHKLQFGDPFTSSFQYYNIAFFSPACIKPVL